MSDFGGGGPLPDITDLDFGAALNGFKNLGDNPTVFSICVALVLLFCVLLVWARKKDERLDRKVNNFPSQYPKPLVLRF